MMTRRLLLIVLTGAVVCAAAGCGSSSKAATGPTVAGDAGTATTTAPTGAPNAATHTATMPDTGCVITDQAAGGILGETVKGTSTKMPGGFMCSYTTESGDRGMSVSIKSYPDAASARQLVDALTSSAGQSIVKGKPLAIGDDGAIAQLGPLEYARFTEGDIFVEVTVRPVSESEATAAAKLVAAAL